MMSTSSSESPCSEPYCPPCKDECCAESIDVLLKGKMQGQANLFDYLRNFRSRESLGDELSELGPFFSMDWKQAGRGVQIITTTSGNPAKCTFTQEVKHLKARLHGNLIGLGGKPIEGVTQNDMGARPGQPAINQGGPPFRQNVNGQPGFADAPSVPYKDGIEWNKQFNSCIKSSPGATCKYSECCIRWTVRIKVEGNVVYHSADKVGPHCQ